MSTIKKISIKCAVCDIKSNQAVLTSYSLFGEPDLDFRPAPMLRSTMKYWLMECPNCEYVAKNLCGWTCTTKETLRQIYSGLDASLPLSAQAFHKKALYCEHVRDATGALCAYLCAAWACDDEEDDIHAVAMRLKCLELAQKRLNRCCRSKWRKYMQLIADLLRRTHRGLPVSTDNPYNVDDLAKVVTSEFLDMMETFAVPHCMVRERVTLQNKTCMAILYQLYTSPNLDQKWKNYADAQERLYLMRIDDLFSDDSYLVGLIEPRTLR